ncbi:MAG: hypothetical protein RL272_311 [Candidatus Parcubacteria bacterium]|jgi:molecular chaperone GrpE
MDEQQQNPPAQSAADAPSQDAAAAQPDELAKAKALSDEYLAGWKRATADYANLRKEMERSQADLAKYAAAGLVGKLLPTIESLRKAADHTPVKEGEPLDDSRVKQWVDGIGHVRSQLESALAAAGVAPIDQAGIPFDPTMHDAMMMQAGAEGQPPGTVAKVLEPGWKLHDRVIRPAKVVVAE